MEPNEGQSLPPSEAQNNDLGAPPSGRKWTARRSAGVLAIALGLLVAGMVWIAVVSTREANPRKQMEALGSQANGKDAPDFDLKTLDGNEVKLSALRGKGVMLNFWATYCSPCKVEMPWLEEFQKQYAEKGFTVVGVTMDDASPQDIQKFISEMGVTYPVVLGTDAVGDTYGAQFLPTSVYIDRTGKIVQRVYGLVNRRDIEENIQKTLGPALVGQAPAGTVAQHP